MPGFAYDPAKGKFRSYLKTVTVHAVFKKTRQKVIGVSLEQVAPAADTATTDAAWENQWRRYHVRQALKALRAEFNETDRTAFTEYALSGRSAKDAAEMLGISVDQVYQAKSRILKRLGDVIESQVRAEG